MKQTMETLFGPTERREAEEFLASGGKPIRRGFDPLEPEIRRTMIERPAKEFIDFQVWPVPPALGEISMLLPADWQDRPAWFATAETLCREAGQLFALPEHLTTSINERRELWIVLK